MGVFRQFPYSNFHEMNMDEIIKIIKNMLEEWAQYHAEWDRWMADLEASWTEYQDDVNAQWAAYQNTMNTAWQSMQNFINNYFDNLDVQEEINNKIVSMIQTGEFGLLVNEYIPPAVNAWLNLNITQPTGVVIDTSLTVAGACADAKATGDAINKTNELLDTTTITETINGTPTMTTGYVDTEGSSSSSPDYTHTNKIPVNKGDVIKILGDGVARTCRFVCAYSGETAVSAKGAENVGSYTVPYGIDSVILSTGYSSSWTYTYSIVRSSVSSERLDTIESDTELLNNLLIISTRTNTSTHSPTMTSGYVSTDGEITTSSSYVYTEKIAVEEGEVIYAYADGVQKSLRFVCAYDDDIALSAKGAENVGSYTVPSGVNYVRLSITYVSTWTYTYTITRNEQYSQRLANIESSIVDNKINSNSTNETFLESCKQSLKKNVCVSYFANFNEFTSLLIGFTKGTSATDYIDRFEITPTNIILHRVGQTDITWTHGLTIQDYISVSISFDFAQHFIINVETNGGSFTQDNYVLLGSRYMPFAILTATDIANNKLAMTCKDFKRNILLFGDSYISNSSARWIYYLGDSISQLCLNGYSGEGSESAVYDFDNVIQLASPRYIVWCMGMNDSSDVDDTTPSATWLAYIQHVISACEENGIIPILATIPSVPSINNRAKSAWVRSSGYTYIDFASAVNSDNSGNWYSGMLSSDNVHPTAQGAKALYNRAITDFPQLLVISN